MYITYDPWFQVVRKLQTIYGNFYTDENVLISDTHPGGYWQYEFTSPVLMKESLDVIVDGVVESIKIGM